MAESDDAHGGTDAQLGPVWQEGGRHRLAVMDARRPDQPGPPIRPIGPVFDRHERFE